MIFCSYNDPEITARGSKNELCLQHMSKTRAPHQGKSLIHALTILKMIKKLLSMQSRGSRLTSTLVFDTEIV